MKNLLEKLRKNHLLRMSWIFLKPTIIVLGLVLTYRDPTLPKFFHDVIFCAFAVVTWLSISNSDLDAYGKEINEEAEALLERLKAEHLSKGEDL